VVRSEWSLKPVYNVVARLDGSEYPDEWVLRGNHHDGWVFGTADPLAGNVAMLAEAKALGVLAKNGWRPKRTLVYASWDGEEAGLLGSTEWVEAHRTELADHAVAYINTDTNAHGFLRAAGSHSLQRLLTEVSASVLEPGSTTTLLARSRADAIVSGAGSSEGNERARARSLLESGEIPLAPLGSGSDFTAFIHHAGIPSLNVGFHSEQPEGAYHSAYDTFDRHMKFGDPDLRYGVTLARVNGRLMLRLASSELLPLRTQNFASAVSHYVEEIESLADAMRAQTAQANKLIDAGLFVEGADRDNPVGQPPREMPVPYLNLAPLKNAAAALSASARVLDEAYAAALGTPDALGRERVRAVNADLRRAERSLLSESGLPGRSWYRHMVNAPGLYTGYGSKTLPAVRESIEERRWNDVDEVVRRTAAAFDAYRGVLDAAASKLR
jgi:N-acetylated-alpha-linked acidic dipeptidase